MVVARSNAVEWESNGVESQSIHSCNHCIRRILNDVKRDAFLLCLPVQVPAVLLQSDYEPELRHHNNDRHPAQHDDDGDGAPRRTSAADQHSQLHQPTLYRRLRARVRHETNWVGGLWGSEWVRTEDGSKVKGRVRHEAAGPATVLLQTAVERIRLLRRRHVDTRYQLMRFYCVTTP